MAARTFYQFRGTLEPELVTLYATVSVGAGGAVTFQRFDPASNTYSAAAAAGWRGVLSVVRVSTGLWTVTFQDTYQRCIYMGASVLCTTAGPAAPVVSLVTGALNNIRSNTAPTLQVLFSDDAGTTTDPASGEQVTLKFDLSNSSLPT